MRKRAEFFRAVPLPFLIMTILLLGALTCVMPGLAVSPAFASSGTGWVEQTPFPGLGSLNDIDAFDIHTAWAVGDGGTILKTIDGGDSWEIQRSGETEYLREVCAVDAMTAWVAGDNGGDAIVLSTGDGGQTWVSHDAVSALFRVVPGGEYINTVNAFGVAALDADTAWVTVNYYASVPNPFYPPFYISSVFASSVWKTVDGGESWTSQYFSLQPERLLQIYALDGQTLWTAGGNTMSSVPGAPASCALKSLDAGSTWVTQDPQASYALNAFSAVDGYVAWGSQGSYLRKSVDGGASWVPLDPGLSYSITDVAAENGDTAWITGLVPVVQGKQGIIAKTRDGGLTFSAQYSGSEDYLHGVCVVDSLTAWAVGEHGVILKTENGGDASPDIVSLIPPLGTDGTEVTIYGCDFGALQGTSYVAFGETPASEYISWSDTQIKARIPAGMAGEIAVTVTTPEGTSNVMSFWKAEKLTVSSLTPDQGSQYAFALNIDEIAGNGFQAGAMVRLEKDAAIIQAYNVNVVSSAQITCTVGLFGVEPGVYDVVVTNPDGQEARLDDAFTVVSACGSGSGAALLVLGLTLGLLSVAGSLRLKKTRKRDK